MVIEEKFDLLLKYGQENLPSVRKICGQRSETQYIPCETAFSFLAGGTNNDANSKIRHFAFFLLILGKKEKRPVPMTLFCAPLIPR